MLAADESEDKNLDRYVRDVKTNLIPDLEKKV
jgi:hypothetical protein